MAATNRNLTVNELDHLLSTGLNTLWLIVTGIGIVLMQAGFMALEVGTVRAKNAKSALFKNVIDHAMGALMWFCVGYGFFLGSNPFASGPDSVFFVYDISEFARIFQQYGFAVTATTIVSGAVLSRCRLWVYLGFSAFIAGFIYPIEAHWAWVPGGWLAILGFQDYAGSTIVHVLGGSCAFIGAMACGPRVGRFGEAGDGGSEASKPDAWLRRGSEDQGSEGGSMNFKTTTIPLRHRIAKFLCCNTECGYQFVDFITLNYQSNFRVREQPGHSAPMQCLGALLLYVAWFSFNAGSSGGLDTVAKIDGASRAAINTMLAAASGSVVALVWCDVFKSQYDITLVVNGLLGSMVAITSGCGYIDSWAAIVCGALSVPVNVGSAKFILYFLQIDDPLDASSVHGACGMFGTLWTGITSLTGGLIYTGSPYLLGVQALGTFAVAGWGMGLAALYFFGLRFLLPYIRICRDKVDVADENEEVGANPIVYSQDAQLVGLDFFYFGGSGFPDFDVEAVSEYNATQRIKNKFKAKRAGSMRMFDREPSNLEISTHGGLSTHGGGFSTHGKHVSTSLFEPPTPLNKATLAHPTPNNNMQQKRPSEQVILVDSHSFQVENPNRDDNDDGN